MKVLVMVGAMVLAGMAYANESSSDKGGIEKAMAECQAMADAKTNRTAFDACMKAKGFERPKDK